MCKKYNVLELFAGAGGMALGFHKAGLNNIGLVEIDSDASKTLNSNFNNVDIYNKDIKNFIKEDLNNIKKAKDIDIVSGGFPCQSFSYAGKREGLNDSRGQLFYSFLDVVSKTNPKIFVFENVKGLLNHDNGKTFNYMKNKLSLEGYNIVWEVLNSVDYSVPQKRQRLFCIGIRNDLDYKKFNFPKKHNNIINLIDVIKDLPDSEGLKYNEKKYNIMKLVPPKGCWKNLPEEIAKEYMGKSYFLGGGKTGMARRLGWDEPSLTLTTSPMQKQTERCHPEYTRPLNILEYSLLQTFPKDYVFSGSVYKKYKQIGNAVPVKLAYCVGLEIKKFLSLVEGKINEL